MSSSSPKVAASGLKYPRITSPGRPLLALPRFVAVTLVM